MFPELCRGRVEMATYRDPIVEFYRKNPLIEALPPILSEEDSMEQLARYATVTNEQRHLAKHIRLHYLRNATRFFQPLSQHFKLQDRLSVIIREGYRTRNPCNTCFWHDSKELAQYTTTPGPDVEQHIERSSAAGMTLLGISGMGKSTAIDEILLNLYPQTIFHSAYQNEPFSFQQIVWLKLECPSDGSLKNLMEQFFWSLGLIFHTNYYADYAKNGKLSAERMLFPMAHLALAHGLGVLVIDEIQNINRASSGGAQNMLNFFVKLINLIGVPVVLVGTPQAIRDLTAQFRMARRGSGHGDMLWQRMNAEDDDWDVLITALWEHAYLQQMPDRTPELSKALHHASCGITDVAIKLFMFTQRQALEEEREYIVAEDFLRVAATDLNLAEPTLAALREAREEQADHVVDIRTDIVITSDNAPQRATNGNQAENLPALPNLLQEAVARTPEHIPAYQALKEAGYVTSLDDCLRERPATA
jgi:hypothetical protein